MRSAHDYGYMRLTSTEPGELVARRVAAEVRAEMFRQGLSQQALADLLGWPQPRLSRRIADGKTALIPLDVVELEAIAVALGVPVTQFLPTHVSAA